MCAPHWIRPVHCPLYFSCRSTCKEQMFCVFYIPKHLSDMTKMSPKNTHTHTRARARAQGESWTINVLFSFWSHTSFSFSECTNSSLLVCTNSSKLETSARRRLGNQQNWPVPDSMHNWQIIWSRNTTCLIWGNTQRAILKIGYYPVHSCFSQRNKFHRLFKREPYLATKRERCPAFVSLVGPTLHVQS